MSDGRDEFPRDKTEILGKRRNTPVDAILNDYCERLNVVAFGTATIRDTVTQWKGEFDQTDHEEKGAVESAILLRLGRVISRLEADVHVIREQLASESVDLSGSLPDQGLVRAPRIRRG